MTISVFSVSYNSSTFYVGIIIGAIVVSFPIKPRGKATSRSLAFPLTQCLHTIVRAVNTLKFVSHRFLVACDSSFHAVFSKIVDMHVNYSCFCLLFEAEHVVHYRSSARPSFLSISIRLTSNAFGWQTSKFGQL